MTGGLRFGKIPGDSAIPNNRSMNFSTLLARSPVSAARARIRVLAADTLREQLRIVQIPAPTFQEGERASYVADRLTALGAVEVGRDEVGNVLARVSDGEPGQAPVVVAAHLDTVFGADVPLSTRRVATRTYAPGITDNARGVAALLTLSRAIVETGLPTRHPVHVVGTVGEEGLGDLRGAKHLFRDRSPLRDAAAFVALDGSGLRRVVHRAIGSRRLRVTVTGPGGHSWSDWGSANPVNALGLAVASLREMESVPGPTATLTVARIGGGTSINSIPAEGWMELDLRSENPAALAALEARTRDAIAAAVQRESAARRARTLPLELTIDVVGDRPAGGIPADHPLVKTAASATRAVGARPELVASSTDANAALARGIPAVTIGAGGDSGGVHTPEEWYDDASGAAGLERVLLLVLGAAG